MKGAKLYWESFPTKVFRKSISKLKPSGLIEVYAYGINKHQVFSTAMVQSISEFPLKTLKRLKTMRKIEFLVHYRSF